MASPTWWTWIWASVCESHDREAWCAAVHGVTKSWIRLHDWTTNTAEKESRDLEEGLHQPPTHLLQNSPPSLTSCMLCGKWQTAELWPMLCVLSVNSETLNTCLPNKLLRNSSSWAQVWDWEQSRGRTVTTRPHITTCHVQGLHL